MKKTTYGSFIISCVWDNSIHENLNNDIPKYKNKEVCVIQCKILRCEDRKTIVMYELIYV